MAVTTPATSPRISVRSLDSIATSVPVPIAMPEVGLDERRRVVDAVTDHGHDLAGVLQALHLVLLVLGQHLGDDPVDADGVGDRLRGSGVVAGDHRDGQVEVVQSPHGLDRRRLECVGDGDHAADLAVPAGEDGGAALVSRAHRFGVEPVGQFEARVGRRARADRPRRSCRRRRRGCRGRRSCRMPVTASSAPCAFASGVGDGLADRMLAVGLDGAGLGEQLGLARRRRR